MPTTTAADDIHEYFFHFSEKIRLDVSSESSARQRIHIKKNQALFSSKDRSKKLKCRLLHVLFGASRVNAQLKSFLKQNIFIKVAVTNFLSTKSLFNKISSCMF